MYLNIIYENDTKLDDTEAFYKGYRSDVIVEIDDKRYKVYITSMVRLQQDFERTQECLGYYISKPNTIIVNEVTKEEIDSVVRKMYECKFFEHLDKNGF